MFTANDTDNTCETKGTKANQRWLWLLSAGIFAAVGGVEIITEGFGPSPMIWFLLGILMATDGIGESLSLRETFTTPKGWVQLALLGVVIILFAMELTT